MAQATNYVTSDEARALQEHAGQAFDVFADPRRRMTLHYPDPTLVSRIVADLARLAALSIVMDPGTDRHVQIFAPQALPAPEALSVIILALESVGLRLLQVDTRLLRVSLARQGVQST